MHLYLFEVGHCNPQTHHRPHRVRQNDDDDDGGGIDGATAKWSPAGPQVAYDMERQIFSHFPILQFYRVDVDVRVGSVF